MGASASSGANVMTVIGRSFSSQIKCAGRQRTSVKALDPAGGGNGDRTRGRRHRAKVRFDHREPRPLIDARASATARSRASSAATSTSGLTPPAVIMSPKTRPAHRGRVALNRSTGDAFADHDRPSRHPRAAWHGHQPARAGLARESTSCEPVAPPSMQRSPRAQRSPCSIRT